MRETDTAPLLVLTPGLEWRFGRGLFLGFDVSFLSTEEPTGLAGRRSVTAPGLRARLSFDLVEHLVAEAVFGAGVAFWGNEGGPSVLGWTRRMAFGGAYEVTDTLWAFVWLGSQVVEAGAAGKGPMSAEYTESQPAGVAAFSLSVGVRTDL